MRTIKFRGLRTNEPNTWVYGFYIEHADGSCSITHPSFTVIKETVGQFTGLFDKQGKEIYERDILKDGDDKHTLVGWSEKFASFVLNRDGWAFSHWFGESCDPKNCEVIGNIYENKDLLK
jgi:uncharacterized phage protein (TIGR01671 family)